MLGAANDTVKPGELQPALSDKYQYDVIVIGGGSGGLACSREVATLQGKVALFDFVHPSPQGTKWGIGGTCVNVGCIPKKLMHHAALLGQSLHDAGEYGWQVPDSATIKHSWGALADNVQDYIRGTNWGYKNVLRDERVEYINASARVVDGHTVEYYDKRSKSNKRMTAAHIVIAVGGRPKYPDNVQGAEEFGITSDDLFWLPASPGKTLLVGAGYVALECAGFLNEIQCPASVMIRGQALRGFDQDIAERILSNMAATGVYFLRNSSPTKLERGSTGADGRHRVKVTWSARVTSEDGSSSRTEQHSEEFDTVVFATGRAPETGRLGLDAVGVVMDQGGKVVGGLGKLKAGQPGVTTAAGLAYTNQAANAAGTAAGSSSPAESHPSDDPTRPSLVHGARSLVHSIWTETTSVPSIHAVGDVLAGRPELTPVAIRAGKLLAQRIMRGVLPTDPPPSLLASADPYKAPSKASSAHKMVMDYALVPTTVFTPLEYGCVGLSEEEALTLHGREVVDVYHLQYDTLELGVAHRKDAQGKLLPPQCYAKMVCVKQGKEQRVVGLHVLGPHAGEVIQGFAVALRMGATREDVMSTVGIHPTHAEELVTLDRNKKDGKPAVKTSC